MGAKVTPERVGWYKRVKHGESMANVARDVGLSSSRVCQICGDYDYVLANPWDTRRDMDRAALLGLIGGDVDCMPCEVFADQSEFLAHCAKRNRKG